MKLFSLLSSCVAVAFCALATLAAIAPNAFAQEVAAGVAPHDLVTRSVTVDGLFVLTALVALVLVAVLAVLIVRSDRSRHLADDDDQLVDPWALPDDGRSWPG